MNLGVWPQLIEKSGCRRDFPGQNQLTCVLVRILLTVIILYRYRLKTRHHKFSEKSKQFSYLDYFTYPVCQHQHCVQRCPDNRGSAVSQSSDLIGHHTCSCIVSVSSDNTFVTKQLGYSSKTLLPCKVWPHMIRQLGI